MFGVITVSDDSFRDLGTSGFCGHMHSHCTHVIPVLLDFVEPSHMNGHFEFVGISPKSLSMEYIAVEALIFEEATPTVLLFHIPVFQSWLLSIWNYINWNFLNHLCFFKRNICNIHVRFGVAKLRLYESPLERGEPQYTCSGQQGDPTAQSWPETLFALATSVAKHNTPEFGGCGRIKEARMV